MIMEFLASSLTPSNKIDSARPVFSTPLEKVFFVENSHRQSWRLADVKIGQRHLTKATGFNPNVCIAVNAPEIQPELLGDLKTKNEATRLTCTLLALSQMKNTPGPTGWSVLREVAEAISPVVPFTGSSSS